MSNQIDFVKNSAEVLSSAKNIVKTDGVIVNGETVKLKACGNAKLYELMDKMSDEELSAFATQLGWSEDYTAPTKSADEITVDLSSETMVDYVTEAGVTVPCVELEYLGESNNNNYNFAMSNGVLTHGGDTLRELDSYGGLQIGDKVLFKPESIKPSKNVGYFSGIPNFRANTRIVEIMSYNRKMNSERKKFRARLSKAGYSKEQITAKLDEKFGAQLEQGIKVPSAPTFG